MVWEYVEIRPVDFVVRKVDKMEGSQITRDKGRPKKTARETIKKNREINELDQNMVYNRTNIMA